MKFRGKLFSSCIISFTGPKCPSVGQTHKIEIVHYIGAGSI